jgi:uncharacterized protein YegP (UPF0339 family)
MSANERFEIYKDKNQQYRWRLKGGNGEIVAASEPYTTKAHAQRSVNSMPDWTAATPVHDLTGD